MLINDIICVFLIALWFHKRQYANICTQLENYVYRTPPPGLQCSFTFVFSNCGHTITLESISILRMQKTILRQKRANMNDFRRLRYTIRVSSKNLNRPRESRHKINVKCIIREDNEKILASDFINNFLKTFHLRYIYL